MASDRVLFGLAASTAAAGVLMAALLAGTGRATLALYALAIAAVGAIQAILAWRRLRS